MTLDKKISAERLKTSLVFGFKDSLVSGMLTHAVAAFTHYNLDLIKIEIVHAAVKQSIKPAR
ncbi:hypothetical protein CCR75_009526 [Bremia lactucae]|uniref:Uncharacterized protein n=1 Tax=Bremia lactucae TaxID=4779 RepID=A0A976FJ62_BRELC|nr:hypothetical protein CCR75_009526 [Bremia lactucae]